MNEAEWPVRPLGDTASFEYGAALPARRRVGDEFPVFGSNGEVGRHRAALVKGPGIVVGRKGTVGALVWSENDFWPIDTTYFVETRPSINKRWLYWAMSNLGLDQLDSSTGVPGLNRNDAYRMRLAVPPVDQQRRVAEVLDTLDDQISATEQIASKLSSVQIGLLRSLLGTRSVGHSVTRQHDIPLPSDWRSLPLADVVGAPITYGIVQAGPHVPGGVPYVRTGDMSGDRLSVEGMLRTSRRIANSYARSTVHTDELVCAIRATVGKVLPVPPELDGANLTQGTARIAPGRLIDPRFLYWEMCGERVQDQIALAIKGTTFYEITLAALRQVRVAMPSLPAQREIAEVLDTHEALVRREGDLLAQLRALKAGLMDDLLTGRVRLPDEVMS